MTSADPSPTPTAEPPTDEPRAVSSARRSRPRGLLRATAVVATLGVVVALAGLGLSLTPVRSPTQDCGTAFTYLLGGKVDVYVDPTSPPKGVTPAEAEANNRRPCQERAAAKGLPALLLAVGGTALAVAAAVTEVTVRVRRHRSVHAWTHLPGTT